MGTNQHGRFVWMQVRMAGLLAVAICGFANVVFAADTNTPTPGWLTQPISMLEAIRTALSRNGDILKSQQDFEAAHGVAMQTRAILIPKVRGSASYEHNEAVEDSIVVKNPGQGSINDDGSLNTPEDEWRGSIRVVQSLYEGGRMRSAYRAARLTKEQAYLEYQTVVANTVLDVRTAYYDVLLAQELIGVQEASVKLLQGELDRTKQRFDAGAVPHFNVIRAEVKIANAQPGLIRANNEYRTAKTRLALVLGYDIPPQVSEDIPMTLTTKLTIEPLDVALPSALARARERRPELGVLRADVALKKEGVIVAKAGNKPSLGVFAGYNSHSSEFQDRFYDDVSGPFAGVAMTWDIFDGRATQGRVMEARARHAKAGLNLEDQSRRIEQEVRTAYSKFIEAREVIESQKKVTERAEEAVRLADARYDAGSGTQLDVLDAQTSLTEARSTASQAAHDYQVARARVERAIGLDIAQEVVPQRKELEIKNR